MHTLLTGPISEEDTLRRTGNQARSGKATITSYVQVKLLQSSQYCVQRDVDDIGSFVGVDSRRIW